MQDHLRWENRHAASWEDGVPRHSPLPPRIPRLQDYSHRLWHSCRDPGQSCVTYSLNPPGCLCVLIRCLDSLNLCPFYNCCLSASVRRPVVRAGGRGVSRWGNSGVVSGITTGVGQGQALWNPQRDTLSKVRKADYFRNNSKPWIYDLKNPLRLWINKFAKNNLKKPLTFSSCAAGLLTDVSVDWL